MMSGALDALDDRLNRGFVITKDGHVDRELPGRIEVREAAHPVLDERSVAATHRLLEWVAGIPRDALVLCLISGGGSALLEEPVEGVSLADFQEMTRLLLRAGADIYQLNAVRSQVSKVKCGGLRAAIPADRVVSLLLSDVLGNDPTVIASGPTVPANSTRTDAIEVITRIGLTDKIPASIMTILESPEDRQPESRLEDVVEIVADNLSALDAAGTSLADDGCRVHLDHEPRTGEAQDIAREWVMHLRDVPSDFDAVIAGGELTVTVTGDGTGGRNTEFALAAAIELERLGITGWTVASLATDGQDGPTDVAGAIVDATVPSRLRARHIDPIAALRNNDSCPTARANRRGGENGSDRHQRQRPLLRGPESHLLSRYTLPNSTNRSFRTERDTVADATPLILDVDTGVDDALAIGLAVSRPDIDLLAVSTLAGNIDVVNSTENSRRVLGLLGASAIPVHQGASRPLIRPHRDASHYHGTNGLGDAQLPEVEAPLGLDRGPAAIIRLAKQRPGEIVLVATGPLTNVAIALNVLPELPSLLKRFVVMGGSYRNPGNVTPHAEFNIWADPEAAQQVFATDFPDAIAVGLDVSHQTLLLKASWEESTGQSHELAQLMSAVCRRIVR